MTVWVKFDEKDGSKVMLGTQWLGTMWKSGLSDSYAVKCRLHSCSRMVSIKVRHWDDVNCQNIFLSSTGTPIPHILHLTRVCSLHHACLSRRTHPVCARAKRTVSSARCLADHGADAPTKVFEWFFCGLPMTGSFGHRDHRRLWKPPAISRHCPNQRRRQNRGPRPNSLQWKLRLRLGLLGLQVPRELE